MSNNEDIYTSIDHDFNLNLTLREDKKMDPSRGNEFIGAIETDGSIVGPADIKVNAYDLHDFPGLIDAAFDWVERFDASEIEGATYTAIETEKEALNVGMNLTIKVLRDPCKDDEDRKSTFESIIERLDAQPIGHTIETFLEKKGMSDVMGEVHTVTVHLVVTDYHESDTNLLIRNAAVVIEPIEEIIVKY